MTAKEALAYCISMDSPKHRVIDCQGDAHWIQWSAFTDSSLSAWPTLKTESELFPFSTCLEPYREADKC